MISMRRSDGDTYSASAHQSGGASVLRIREAQSKRLSEFHGLSFFPISTRYRITAEWIPYSKPRTLVMAHADRAEP